ncbi:hypothetical protein KQH82_13375 [bacterium]|nr:hypothetical protein [bacterium]
MTKPSDSESHHLAPVREMISRPSPNEPGIQGIPFGDERIATALASCIRLVALGLLLEAFVINVSLAVLHFDTRIVGDIILLVAFSRLRDIKILKPFREAAVVVLILCIIVRAVALVGFGSYYAGEISLVALITGLAVLMRLTSVNPGLAAHRSELRTAMILVNVVSVMVVYVYAGLPHAEKLVSVPDAVVRWGLGSFVASLFTPVSIVSVLASVLAMYETLRLSDSIARLHSEDLASLGSPPGSVGTVGTA